MSVIKFGKIKYLLMFMSVFIISCSSSSPENSDLCEPNPCKDSLVAHKTVCETVGDNDFKCVCETGFTDDNGACKKDVIVDECTDGATKCNMNELLTCENKEWTRFDCSVSNKKCETEGGKSSCISEVIETGSIYPIRKGDVAQDSRVNVKAIITGIKLDDSSKIEGFFIQEDGSDYRGIYIYAKNGLEDNLSIGDEVNVSGIYKEYNGLSEIVVEFETEVVKTDFSSPRSDFKLLNIDKLTSQNIEEYESMLVAVKGKFTVGDRDNSGNLQIKVDDGSVFIIRDDLYSNNLNKNDTLSEIRGVLAYNFAKFKIFPRGDYDLIDNTAICSQVSCGEGEVCEVTDDTPACICDEQHGYFDDSGDCKNPCSVEGTCVEDNKHTCVPVDAINFTCECDSGYELSEDGSCEAAAYCDVATYGSAFGLTGNALKTELNSIVNRTFVSYGYSNGRRAMFSYIDNYDGQFMGIYTGEYANHPHVSDKVILIDEKCENCPEKPDNNTWNWEHTWPKSKGTGTLPAKADLHHLFPTRAYVNSARSSLDFGNVEAGADRYCDDGNSTDSSCDGYDYVSERKSGLFEVADQHKGNTARAMFYIYVKYNLGGANYLSSTEAKALKIWHLLDSVDTKERGRNDRVEELQHNRNPFVDCPQFVDALFE